MGTPMDRIYVILGEKELKDMVSKGVQKGIWSLGLKTLAATVLSGVALKLYFRGYEKYKAKHAETSEESEDVTTPDEE